MPNFLFITLMLPKMVSGFSEINPPVSEVAGTSSIYHNTPYVLLLQIYSKNKY